jgi:16S rRNA (adenine1518-N6/adenine1519-N6)-dimethyltransferase
MKKLGQHFLKNKLKIKKIIGALNLEDGDTVIEIGPGHGELTRLLAEKLQITNYKLQIIAIEKDKKLYEKLVNNNWESKNIKFINGDALKILPALVKTKDITLSSRSRTKCYKILGNIPYYITGRLLRIVGDLEPKPELIILTVQKEVAERVCAKPPSMNLLAASVQFWAEAKIIDHISKRDFRPVPKVDSVVIKLRPITSLSRSRKRCYGLKERYYWLVKILFKQPRKTILNNLKSGLKLKKEEIIKRLSLLKADPETRPQNLNVENLKKLAELLYN